MKLTANVPQQYPENHALGIWVNKQRMEKKAKDDGKASSMTNEKAKFLEEAGFVWAKGKGQECWENSFRKLQKYFERHGDCKIYSVYLNLSSVCMTKTELVLTPLTVL